MVASQEPNKKRMSYFSSAYQRICVLQFHAEETHYRSETSEDTKLRVQKPNGLYWSKLDPKLTISKRQPDELITKVKAYASLTGSRTETRAELDEVCTQLCKTTATCSMRLAQFLIAGNLTIAKAQKMQTIQTKSSKLNYFALGIPELERKLNICTHIVWKKVMILFSSINNFHKTRNFLTWWLFGLYRVALSLDDCNQSKKSVLYISDPGLF